MPAPFSCGCVVCSRSTPSKLAMIGMWSDPTPEGFRGKGKSTIDPGMIPALEEILRPGRVAAMLSKAADHKVAAYLGELERRAYRSSSDRGLGSCCKDSDVAGLSWPRCFS